MATSTNNPLTAGIDQVRDSWIWFMALGIVLAILGMFCIIFDLPATFKSVVVFGWLLLISGIVELVEAFRTGSWSGFFMYLLGALLSGFTGYAVVRHPTLSAESLAVLLGTYFIVGGLFRAIGSGMARFPGWSWAVFSGIVSVTLGLVIFGQMPNTPTWFLGFAVGTDLIFDGVAVASFASGIHHLPKGTVFHAA